MQQQFQKVLKAYSWQQKRILVAVSGGVDSMLLLHLLYQAGVSIAIAHCNFGLRHKESDGDEQLVKDWAVKNDVPIFVQHFNTSEILNTQGGNLQEVARKLRYNWFEHLRINEKFDLIATAHHKQDNAETLLINLFKGTGIAGLHGILPQQNYIIRPLLSFSKEDIIEFANAELITWRDDSSNKQDKYLRNALRHHLFPVLENIFPNYLEALAQNAQRFSEVETLYQQSITGYRKKLMEQRGKEWYFPVLKLKHIPALRTILWELLKPFRFSPVQIPDIANLVTAESGKFVASETHKIIKDRNFLIVTPIEPINSDYIWVQENDIHFTCAGFQLSIQRKSGVVAIDTLKQLPKNEIWVDLALLTFPLLLRPWKQGDYFYPIGMQKKKKKVSKILIEQKIPLHQKENVWILESQQKIVWIIGIRADERFKISPKTVNSIIFSVNEA